MLWNFFYKNSVTYLKVIITKVFRRRKVKVLREYNRNPYTEESKCSVERKMIMRDKISWRSKKNEWSLYTKSQGGNINKSLLHASLHMLEENEKSEARRSYWSITWTLQFCTKRECGEWKISLLNCFSERIRMRAIVNLEVKEQRFYGIFSFK